MKLGLLFVLCLIACNPGPIVPPPADASIDAAPAPIVDASADAAAVPSTDAKANPCENACRALAAAGCAEGSNPDCVVTCDHVLATHLVALDVACLAEAKSSADIVQCGGSCSSGRQKRP